MWRVVPIGVVTALVLGCGVSKQVLEEQQAELDARQGQVEALEARVASAEQALAASRAGTDGVREELQVCRDELSAAAAVAEECAEARRRAEKELGELGDLRERLEGARAAALEADRMKEREAQLRRDLELELEEKAVEIEALQGRLAVRVLDQVLFDSGSAEITGGGAALLAKMGPVLAEGQERIRVEGHTDDLPVGPGLKALYYSNWELGAARAAAVVRYLQYGQGVDPARLEVVGLGGTRPLEPNDTPRGRQRNRRVEIVLAPPR